MNARFSRQIGVIGSDTQLSLSRISLNIYVNEECPNPVIHEFIKCGALMGISRIHIITTITSPIKTMYKDFPTMSEWVSYIAPHTHLTQSAAEYEGSRNCYFDGNWNADYYDRRPLIIAKIKPYQAIIMSDFGSHEVYDASGEVPLESFYRAEGNIISVENPELFSGMDIECIIDSSRYSLRHLGDNQYNINITPNKPAGVIREAPRRLSMKPSSHLPSDFRWGATDNTLYALYSTIAGISAHEILKLTGKYIPAYEPIIMKIERYMNLLTPPEQKVLIAGAGAIGCELIKNSAIYGNGHYIVRDMDKVSESNLSRQILFTDASIGQWKASTAINEASKYNNGASYEADNIPLSRDTDIYNNQIIATADILLNALDNISAREYMDTKSRAFSVPLIDAGTLGTKGHVQVCIPNRTMAWCDIRDPPIRETPVCTLTSFPNSFRHCIEWAIAKYGEQDTKSYDTPMDWWNGVMLEPIKSVLSAHPATDSEFWVYGRLCPRIIDWDRNEIERIMIYMKDCPPFDKDDAQTFEIVYLIARMRAELYGICPMTMEEAHTATGLIIPAMITTTSVIAGLEFMEYQMVANGRNPMDWAINLATNELIGWDSADPRIYSEEEISIQEGHINTVSRIGGMGATAWDMYKRGTYRPNKTLREMVAMDIGMEPDDIYSSGVDYKTGIEVVVSIRDTITPILVYLDDGCDRVQ